MDEVNKLPEIIFIIVLAGIIIGVSALIFGQLYTQTQTIGEGVNVTIDFNNGAGSFADTPILTIDRLTSNTSDETEPLLSGAITYNETTNTITLNNSAFLNYLSVTNETVTFVNWIGTTSQNPVNLVNRIDSNDSTENLPVSTGALTIVESTGVMTLNQTRFPVPNASYFVWYRYTTNQDDGNFGAWYTFTANTSSSNAFSEGQSMVSGFNGTWLGLIITVVIIGLVLSIIISTFKFENR